MMFKVSDIGTSYCEIRDLGAPSSNDSQENLCNVLMLNFQQPNTELGFSSEDGDEHDNIELMRMKKVKKNNLETEVDSSTDQSCFVSHFSASCLHTDSMFLPQDFTSSNDLKRKCGMKDSQRQIISSYSPTEKQYVTFTVAPVDVRNCRLRLPMQFTRENGINKPGKIYLLGKDGSKWLANLLLEKRGRMTLGDGWKSFVKANGLQTGESITFKLNWEDTTPMLSLCPAVVSDKESLPIEPSSGKEIIKEHNKNGENIKEESGSSTLMLTWYDTTPMLGLCPAEARYTESLPIESSCGKEIRKNDNKNDEDIKVESESSTLMLTWYDTTPMLGLCATETRYTESRPIEPSCGKEIRKDHNKNDENIIEESESFETKLNWEDRTPMLHMCLSEYSTETIAGEGSSEASEKESLPREPRGKIKINKNENNKQESLSWKRENMDSSSPSQSRFLTLTITPDCFKNGRLRLPLQFMMENSMNKPGEITLVGKDGTKWLANLLLENTKRMSLGKGWKDFAKANGLKSGDSITFEPFWEVATPVLSLVRIEYSSDRGHVEFQKESCATEPSSGNKTRKAEKQDRFESKKAKNNNEERRKYLPVSGDSSSSIPNRFMTLTHPHEIVSHATHDVQKSQVTIFRYEGDLMYQVLDLGSNYGDIQDVPAPSSNNDHDNIGTISMKIHPELKRETGVLSYDGDDLDNFECSRTKKVKKNIPETEADSSSDHSCVVAHATTSNLHTDAVYLPHDFTSSKVSPCQNMSSYSSSEKQFLTFTLAPVDVRHCRLRLPMQFARENGINKPGKIHLLGKDGSKWLANLNMESKGKLAVGYGWKTFVKANGLKTGESVTLKLTWDNTTPMLSLCPTEAVERESLPIEPSREIEIYNKNDENIKVESFSWENEKNDLRFKDSTSLSENRFVTLTITPDSLKHGRLRLPMKFMRENNMNTPGEITLLDKEGAKWLASLLIESRYRINLGKGWKDFAKANGLKTGYSITFEAIWDDATPMLSLIGIESSNDRVQSEVLKESHAAEPSSGNKTKKAKNHGHFEKNREMFSSGELEINKHLPENRFLTLTLTEENLRDCYLHFPSEYMKTIGIDKPGKITLCGRNGMRWFAYLMTTEGSVSVGNGFKGFCEANGVMLGESFVLEFILKEDTYYVFKFSSNYGDQICM